MSTPHRSLARALLGAALFASAVAAGEADGAGLTLAEAAERTLRESAELAAFSSQVRAADARTIKARLHLNPDHLHPEPSCRRDA